MKNSLGLIILAGGKGSRMNQEIPKVLTSINGVSLIEKLLSSVEKFFLKQNISIVVGYKGEKIIEILGDKSSSVGKYNFVWQKEQLGTAHAISQCRESLQDKYDNFLILYGDTPFIKEQTLKSVIDSHLNKNSIFTMITLKLENFENENLCYVKFGRIIRDQKNNIYKIVEYKDASDEEKKSTEVNPAIYCIENEWLWKNLDKINNENAQNEYYLTDLVSLAHDQKININTIIVRNNLELIGINTPEDLSIAKNIK